MDETMILNNLTQLGAAGVIGWLWLCERRASTTRERQLTEAHDRVLAGRERAETLVGVVRDNASAIATLAETQRSLGDSIDRLSQQFIDERDQRSAQSGRRAG